MENANLQCLGRGTTMHPDKRLNHIPLYSTSPRGAQGEVRRRSFHRTVSLCALLAFAALAQVALAPVSTRAAVATPDGNASSAQSVDFQSIDTYIISQMQAMHVPGVALGIVKGDQIVHIQGFGVANPSGQ